MTQTIETLDSEIATMARGRKRTLLRRTVDALRIAQGERARGDLQAARRFLTEARAHHSEASALVSV